MDQEFVRAMLDSDKHLEKIHGKLKAKMDSARQQAEREAQSGMGGDQQHRFDADLERHVKEMIRQKNTGAN